MKFANIQLLAYKYIVNDSTRMYICTVFHVSCICFLCLRSLFVISLFRLIENMDKIRVQMHETFKRNKQSLVIHVDEMG